MVSQIEYLKNKFAQDRYNHKLANLAYKCAFNKQMAPISWDELNIFGYGVIRRCNRSVLKYPLCEDFDDKYDDYQLLILSNKKTEKVFGLIIPPYDESDIISSYVFGNKDYFFADIKPSKLLNNGWLLTNNSNVQLLAQVYLLTDGERKISFSEIMDEMFIDFSKLCCKMRKAGKLPTYDQAVAQFNKK